MDPIAIIYQYYNNAKSTDTYYSVVKYVLLNMRKVVSQSITQLAEETFTSQATISRFVRMLGLDNYREFRAYLTDVVNSSRNTFLRSSSGALTHLSEDPQAYLTEYTQEVINALQDLQTTLSVTDIDQLITRVNQARHTDFLGYSDSLQIAKDIQLGYLTTGQLIEVAESNQKMQDIAARFDQRDLVVILSNYGNYFNHYHEFYQQLLQTGAQMVLVTQNYNNMDSFAFAQTIFLSNQRHMTIGNYPMRVFSDFYVRRLVTLS